MSSTFTWTFTDPAGAPCTDVGLSTLSFPTQADAEAWLSDEWGTLADAGVGAVTLHEGEDVVYGPMSLSPAD